jgi:hypothetical protein
LSPVKTLFLNYVDVVYLSFSLTPTSHPFSRNDYAARDVCPCVWVTSPEETTYVLKTILRFAGVSYKVDEREKAEAARLLSGFHITNSSSHVDFGEAERRTQAVQEMDVFTGEMK